MTNNTLKVRHKQRYDTEANWTSNDPVLLSGEIAISSDKNSKFKVGDGKNKWSALSYAKADLTKSDVTTALGYSDAGTATQPIYFSDGKPVACTYKVEKSVPADAKFTDNDTWRGIQNNLTSESTVDSLSAYQGKVLKGLIDEKSPADHTHKYAGSSSIGGSATSAVKLDTITAGTATQPVYFSDGKPVACTYTLEKSVPSYAVFTDTNTWRPIEDNLTSTSTTYSLSAAQGKALKALIDAKPSVKYGSSAPSGSAKAGDIYIQI